VNILSIFEFQLKFAEIDSVLEKVRNVRARENSYGSWEVWREGFDSVVHVSTISSPRPCTHTNFFFSFSFLKYTHTNKHNR
jgi:hypothetical protein